MENVQYVFHVASPFPSKAPKDESELIEPAVNGTRNVLAAAVRARVKRFIITSSFAAVGGGHDRKLHEFDETFWSIEEKCDAYYKVKGIDMAALPFSQRRVTWFPEQTFS